MPPVLTVRDLSKAYCTDVGRSLRYGLADIAREFDPGRCKTPALRPGEFWALRDISFEVAAGEAVGLLGANGSGKSTLLRVVHGLTSHSGGTVELRGRSGGMLGLGSAFNPLQTGRENLFSGAAAHGRSRSQISDRIDDMIRFSGLNGAIDHPVRTYSTGMAARLGFALAAHLDLELLLIDEALAVGDLEFRRKATRFVLRFVEQGGSLLLVDHDIWVVQAVCARCVVLDGGRVVFDGPTPEAIKIYVRSQAASVSVNSFVADPLEIDGPVKLVGIDLDWGNTQTPVSREPLEIRCQYKSTEGIDGVQWGFAISTPDESLVIAGALEDQPGGRALDSSGGTLVARIEDLNIRPGTYLIRVVLLDDQGSSLIGNRSEHRVVFEVNGRGNDFDSILEGRSVIVPLATEWPTTL